MEEKKINKSIVFSIVAVLLLVIVVAGSTYAYFRAAGETAVQEITTANLKMNFVAGEWIRADAKMMPISDAEIATKAVELPFSVTNTGDQHMNITVKLTDIIMSEQLKDIDFRWGLYNTDTGKSVSLGLFKNLGTDTEKILLRDTILDVGSATKNYTLRIWIHDNGAAQDSLMGRTFSARVKVTGEAIEYTPDSCFTMDGSRIKDYDVETCGTDVVVPKTINGTKVTAFGGYTYDGSTHNRPFAYKGLTSLIFTEGIQIIGESESGYLPILDGNNIKHITVPENTTVSHKYAFAGMGLDSIIAAEGTITASSIAGNNIQEFIFTGDLDMGLGYYNYNYLTTSDIVLMDGKVKQIGSKTLGSTNLTTIEIPASVTTVDNEAFTINDGNGYSPLTKIVVRGKSSLSEFTGGAGVLNSYQDIIEFRP